jgi:hypothetical protein
MSNGLPGARIGERKASNEITFLIGPLHPASPAKNGMGHLPVNRLDEINLSPDFYFHPLPLTSTSDKNDMHFKSGHPGGKIKKPVQD